MCVSNFHNNNKTVKTSNNESFFLLKPSENLLPSLNQFTNASLEDNANPENFVQSKYYDTNTL